MRLAIRSAPPTPTCSRIRARRRTRRCFSYSCVPEDRILSLALAAGGHLSHGAGANLSGRWFDSHHYGVDRASGLLDDEIEARARNDRIRARAKTSITTDGLIVGHVYEVYGVKD